MNRTLQYLKNIKFNHLVNKTIANEGKRKIAIMSNKNRKKDYQKMSIRKYSSKSRPLSFNTGPFNNPDPPNDPKWIIPISIICGVAFILQKK